MQPPSANRPHGDVKNSVWVGAGVYFKRRAVEELLKSIKPLKHHLRLTGQSESAAWFYVTEANNMSVTVIHSPTAQCVLCLSPHPSERHLTSVTLCVLRPSPTPSLPITPTQWSDSLRRCSNLKPSSHRCPPAVSRARPPRCPSLDGLTPT